MALVAGEQITKKYGDQVVLDAISFTILPGDRVGLVGRNGAGKTTFFDILAGRLTPDSGNVTITKQCLIDYVEQEKAEYYEMSLFDFVASARRDLQTLRRQIGHIQDELARSPEEGSRLQEMGRLQDHFDVSGGFTFENDVKTILTGLGFPENRYDDIVEHFSGGEKNRAALARALAGKGNLLLLDEPTNHLDIESTVWLEEWLKASDKSFVVVSHDRAFLTSVVERVWEIRYSKLDTYSGGFEYYLHERAERRRLQEHRYKHQQEEIKRLQYFVQKHMAGQKTKQAQSKLKYLNRIKRIEAPRGDGPAAAIKLKSSGRSYAHVLSVEGLGAGYEGMQVIDEVTFEVYRGDKVGIIGRNGAGKSTLLKVLIGEIDPGEGEVILGPKVDVAYFDQELADLNPEQTVLESLWEVDPPAEVKTIRSFLGRFGFSGEDHFKMVSALSGGEKTKLSLARLLYHPANFIIFDEPTNHLDLDSREALEEALNAYEGSLLVVSHDRYFLDKVASRILYLDAGRAKMYDGNYSFFKDKQGAEAAEGAVYKTTTEKKTKKDFLSFKEKSKQRARLKKQLLSLRSRIADMERDLKKCLEEINHSIPKSDWEALQTATDKKKMLEDEIIELYEQLEALESSDGD